MSLGVVYRDGNRTLVQALVNTVGQAEPVRGNYGTSLLAPASGKGLSAGLIDIAYRVSKPNTVPICGTLAIHFYTSVFASSARFGLGGRVSKK